MAAEPENNNKVQSLKICALIKFYPFVWVLFEVSGQNNEHHSLLGRARNGV